MTNYITFFAKSFRCSVFRLACILVPVGFLIGQSQSQVLPPPPNYTFPNGRTYVYSVQWRVFTAGNVTVTLQSDGAEQHVIATAASTGLVNAIFRVNDRFEAYFDPQRYCSLRVIKQSEEGSHSRHIDLRFDYSRGQSVHDETNLKTGQTKHTENDIPSCVTDVVSDFYYVSSLPLIEGSSYVFPVNDGGKTSEVTARIGAREKVTVPAGTFETVRVEAEPTTGGLKGRGTIWTWYTIDENRMPVQMRSKLTWGTLTFRLQRVER
jgi:hypothetical protein